MAFKEKEEEDDELVDYLPLTLLSFDRLKRALFQAIMQQLESGALRPSTSGSSTLADDVSSKVGGRHLAPFAFDSPPQIASTVKPDTNGDAKIKLTEQLKQQQDSKDQKPVQGCSLRFHSVSIAP
jgi:hypothetical protein